MQEAITVDPAHVLNVAPGTIYSAPDFAA
jgi:hypothetical protein